jgi:hypothetical protein
VSLHDAGRDSQIDQIPPTIPLQTLQHSAALESISRPARSIDGEMSSASTPRGYSFAKWLRQNENGSVALAIRETDGLDVVLKTYRADRDRGGRSLQVQRELEALRAVAGPGVPAALDLLLTHSPPVLVLARVPGTSLLRWIPEGGVRLADFLSVAVQLTATLMRVHERRLIHRDVTPDNILVDPQTLQTHLIDFGLAKAIGALSRGEGRPSIPESLGGTLSYMAPEQTGRMNRGCDFRSDLYSAGATFYHMLTGRPPFESDDALELVHAHIARLPPDPATLRPDLSEPIRQLLLKLLRKDPEERYQSARALHADLKECLGQVTQRGEIDPGFALGSVEPPDRPRFPARLYGRDVQVAQLHELYQRCIEGKPAALLLRGEAGCGKSTLVSALRPALAARGGCLAIGKFDRQRPRPYSGWIAILEYLAGQLLLERTERLERWRGQLREGVGSIARALVDLVPDLRFILGEVPEMPALDARASRARLSLALQRFLAAFASIDHPLVLLLDDVQWSDAGSRLLLDDLLPSVPPALLLIVAFNSSEAGGAGSDTELIERQQRAGVKLDVLEVPALGREHVAAMLSDALGQPRDLTQSLAELIERKTGNNPLLVRQFVEHVHERGLLRHETGRWTWDLTALAAADIPDGAVALTTAKIAQLGAEPRRALALASCIGDEFDTELLYALAGSDHAGLERGIHALCDLGLIAPCEEGLRFLHSRIREAAQELLNDAEYERVHYQAGTLLLARTPEPKLGEAIFGIVDHLNRGLRRVPPERELEVVQLNLRAGKTALATGAGAGATAYFSVARTLFERSFAEREPELGVEIQLRSAEAAFATRDFEAALELLSALESRTLPWLQSAKAAELRLRIFALTRSAEECVQHILQDLQRVGIRWPLRPTRGRARLALHRAGWELALRGTRNMLRKQTDDDPRALGPLLLATLGGPILRHDLHLSALQTSRVLTWYLRAGYRTSPSFFLAGYAAYRYALLGGARRTRAYAQTALELNRSVPTSAYTVRSEHVVHALIYPWLMTRREAVEPLTRIAESARELGDPEYTYYARFVHAVYLALAGDAIALADPRLRELTELVRRSGHSFAEPEQCQRAYALLTCAERGEVERRISAYASATVEPTAAVQYSSILRAMVLCIYGRHDLVAAETEARGDQVFRVMAGAHLADHVFYRGLAAASLALRDAGPQRRRQRRLVKTCMRKLRGWARAGPDFVHMTWLLQAELECLSGRPDAARTLYDKATARAQQQGYLHHAALACESRARMLLELRRETEAASTLAQAEKLYRQWGALAKARSLEQTRRRLVSG